MSRAFEALISIFFGGVLYPLSMHQYFTSSMEVVWQMGAHLGAHWQFPPTKRLITLPKFNIAPEKLPFL